jgi:histidinol-phosphate aminotransferase
VFNTNNFSNAAAVASLNDPDQVVQERARNKEVRDYTLKFFADAGYESADSQTNFLFVNLDRPASEFRAACAEHNVHVGRDFPPMEKTHCRISIGTMDEMRRATEVFKQVLA